MLFSSRDEDTDLVLEEESPLSLKIPQLTDNYHRLFSHCDESNPQKVMAKNHDFGSIIKPNPFKNVSTPFYAESSLNSELQKQDLRDTVSTSPKTYQSKSVLIRRSFNQDSNLIILCSYASNNKKYSPLGTFKSRESNKFKTTISIEVREMSQSSSLSNQRDSQSFTETESMTSLYDSEE